MGGKGSRREGESREGEWEERGVGGKGSGREGEWKGRGGGGKRRGREGEWEGRGGEGRGVGGKGRGGKGRDSHEVCDSHVHITALPTMHAPSKPVQC